MIRVSRPPTTPPPLTSAVQRYVTSCAAHRASPATVKKPVRPSSYRTSSLLDVFEHYFHAKCYLTEQKFPSVWEMVVDHFEPVTINPSRVFDPSNLYPAAYKANIMRGDFFPPGGLLDPCSDDVENEIRYSLLEQGELLGFQAVDPNNIKAVNTAYLLNLLHNGKPNTIDSQKSARNLRFLIEKKYKIVLETWGKYWRAKAQDDQDDMLDYQQTLQHLLSRESSFTMLMRSIPIIRKDFKHLFDHLPQETT